MKNAVMMNAPKVETGFVGFFDILGYKSFLESGITDVTFRVVDILDELNNTTPIKNALEHHFGLDRVDGTKMGGVDIFENIRRELDRIVIRVISDSIILSYAYDESRSETERPSQAATFLVAASVLEYAMFQEGLPLRGAIAFGDFVAKEYVFAGKPIIHAHTLGQSLDLAACAIHETAENEFKALLAVAPEWNNFLNEGLPLVRYQTPIKNVQTKADLLLLNLAWPTLEGYSPLKDRIHDLKGFVREQFLAHNKQVGNDVIPKLENTERFFQFLADHLPHLFIRNP